MVRDFDIGQFVNALTEESVLNNMVARVKKKRKAMKISQKALAEQSGVSYASIRRFESTGEISLVSLLKIAHALHCLKDFEELFKGSSITNLKDFEG
jgi:transcriptional regulator with XRE-family HTH domain